MATDRMEFRPGQVVRDSHFGLGKVTSANGDAVTVEFDYRHVVQVAQSRLTLEHSQDSRIIARPLASDPHPTSVSVPINSPKIQRKTFSAIRDTGSNRTAEATSDLARLDARQAAIKEFSESRGIKALFHFTQLDNVPSILQMGLLSRKTIARTEIVPRINDAERWDHHLDAISLSISWPNYKMFYLLRQENPGTDWAVLEIDPAALWLCDCAFYPENAASRTVSSQDPSNLKTQNSLKALFEGVTGGRQRNPCLTREHPTNPQAEVLCFGEVRPPLIRTVGVKTVVKSSRKTSTTTEYRPNWFSPRCDYEFWR